MNKNRYRYDTGAIIDQHTGEILTVKQAVIRLNFHEALNKAKEERLKFHVDGYNNVISKINEALANERTELGKSVLKQLLEQME